MYTSILLLPLIGALVAGFFHRRVGERAAITLTTGLLMISAVLSWVAFFSIEGGDPRTVTLMRWIGSGDLQADWAIRVDRLTCVMLVVVTTVSALVHLYAIGYTDDGEHPDPIDNFQGPARARFFAYLSFFTFAMLALVTGDNLLQIFFGWEGVGLASYLLIGFWYRKSSANAAAIKAFVVNRVGDFGFLLGMFGLFYLTGSIQLDDVFAAAPELDETQITFLWTSFNAVELICLLLFLGACGKSAQFLLHTWLPDAMEGPTPVSALIHAATMVTAGVFLVCRMSPLFEYAGQAAMILVLTGTITAFFAATVGLVQNDIKRVIAYSTCSQLGYMFAAAGAGAYEAAMFHLFTHAFFKALLFLGAGSVIRAMHHEQDMRRMGGLRRKIPLTYWTMIAGTLAITGLGVPLTHYGLAGFLSKDIIVESVFAAQATSSVSSLAFSGFPAFWILIAAACMTSFYSWRLIFMTFHGAPRAERDAFEHAHESPAAMTVPLCLLTVGAVLAGVAFYGDFVGGGEAAFWGASIFTAPENHVLHDAHGVPKWVKAAPFAAMVAGLGLAWLLCLKRPDLSARIAERNDPLYRFLLNKWYFDELYDVLFVRPALWLGRAFWRRGDEAAIDGIVNGVSMGLVPRLTRFAGRLQSGFLFHYAFAMLIGVSALITWFAISAGVDVAGGGR